jgi:type II secretory pathway component PulF
MQLRYPKQLASWASFYRQWYQLTRSGHTQIEALKNLGRSVSRAEIKMIIGQILRNLSSGKTLAQSLLPLSGQVPRLDQAILGSGETAGQIEKALLTLSEHYERMGKRRKDLMGKLTYPGFLFLLLILAMPPEHVKLLVEGQGWLFLVYKAPFLGLFFGGLWTLFWLADANRLGVENSLPEKLLSGMPVIGPGRRYSALAHFALTLKSLESAGIVAKDSWRLAAECSQDFTLRQSVRKIQKRLNEGHSPAELIQDSPVFPAEFRGQLLTGEKSGQLEDTLSLLAQDMESLAEEKFQLITTWVPKIIMGILIFVVTYNMYQSTVKSLDEIDKILQ